MLRNKVFLKSTRYIMIFTIFFLLFYDNNTIKIEPLFCDLSSVQNRIFISDSKYECRSRKINDKKYSEIYIDDMFWINDNQMSVSDITETSVDDTEITVNSAGNSLYFDLYENLPKDRIKSYMSYTAITLKTSDQFKLQKIAYTDENGFRKVSDRYCVAVGSYFTDVIGTYLDIILADGTVIECILADQKADKHTDNDNILASDGSLVEFVIDKNMLNKEIKRSGDVSKLYDSWDNHVKTVIVYEIVEEF